MPRNGRRFAAGNSPFSPPCRTTPPDSGQTGHREMCCLGRPISLERVKDVGYVLGCSVNDMLLLASVAGAIRSYLVEPQRCRSRRRTAAGVRASQPATARQSTNSATSSGSSGSNCRLARQSGGPRVLKCAAAHERDSKRLSGRREHSAARRGRLSAQGGTAAGAGSVLRQRDGGDDQRARPGRWFTLPARSFKTCSGCRRAVTLASACRSCPTRAACSLT